MQVHAWYFRYLICNPDSGNCLNNTPGMLLLEDTHLKDHDSYSEIMDVDFNILLKLIAIFIFYYEFLLHVAFYFSLYFGVYSFERTDR